MKSRRYIFAILVAALALSGCKKNYLPVSDHPFDISIPKVEANRVVVDIVPDNNDFYYMFGVAPAEVLDAVGQDAFVSLVDQALKETYKALFGTTSFDKFLDWIYRGAYDEVTHDLQPDTKYIVYAYPYDEINPMAEKFTKVEFTTPSIKKSDNKFSVSADGTVIAVTPTNGDPYFFDYCTPEELDEDYFSSIDYFFRKSIDIYWEYGFLEGFISKGPDQDELTEYYLDIADGEVFYMAISGYDQAITTDVTYYKITVHYGATKSTVEQIEDFDHSTKSSAGPLSLLSRKLQGSDEAARQNLRRLSQK